MGEAAGESKRRSRGNEGDVGDAPGVFRRTKLEMGVFADRSVEESKRLTVNLLLLLLR